MNKKENKQKPMQILLNEDLMQRLNEESERTGIPKSSLVKLCIVQNLQNMEAGQE